jgi:hypothetical protein
MGHGAGCRHDMAYPVSWRRVTHLQRSLRWGNASRFESSLPEILNTAILQNRVYVRFRRLFRFSHRTCDPSSKWAVRGTAKLRQTVGEPGHSQARRVARSAEHLERRSTGGHLGWAVGPGRDCATFRMIYFQFQPARGRLLSGTGPLVVIFSFIRCNFTKLWPPWKIKG